MGKILGVFFNQNAYRYVFNLIHHMFLGSLAVG